MESLPVTTPTPWSIDTLVALTADHDRLVTSPGFVTAGVAVSEVTAGNGWDHDGLTKKPQAKTIKTGRLGGWPSEKRKSPLELQLMTSDHVLHTISVRAYDIVNPSKWGGFRRHGSNN